jgi:N-formylglutamate amidohydrolase
MQQAAGIPACLDALRAAPHSSEMGSRGHSSTSTAPQSRLDAPLKARVTSNLKYILCSICRMRSAVRSQEFVRGGSANTSRGLNEFFDLRWAPPRSPLGWRCTRSYPGAAERFAIDCNRWHGSQASISEISESKQLPENIELSEARKAALVREIFWPYRDRTNVELSRRWQASRSLAMIAMHSFIYNCPRGGRTARACRCTLQSDPRFAHRHAAAYRPR